MQCPHQRGLIRDMVIEPILKLIFLELWEVSGNRPKICDFCILQQHQHDVIYVSTINRICKILVALYHSFDCDMIKIE